MIPNKYMTPKQIQEFLEIGPTSHFFRCFVRIDKMANELKYAVEQRIRMVDFLLNNFGEIRRKHLIDYFGISEACATKDIRKYDEMTNMNNIKYDLRKKCWIKKDSFKEMYQ